MRFGEIRVKAHTEAEHPAAHTTMPTPPSASTNTVTVQADWQNREFVQAVQLGVAHLTSFLNTFGVLASTSPLNHAHAPPPAPRRR